MSSSSASRALGMNAQELEANRRLTDRVVHDLNRDPELPHPDAIMLPA